MPTNTIDLLHGPAYVPVAATSLLSGTAAGTLVKQITLVNNGGTTETVQLYIHTAAPSANHLIQKLVLSAGDTATFNGTLVVPTGNNLYGQTTTVSTVTISIHGMDMA